MDLLICSQPLYHWATRPQIVFIPIYSCEYILRSILVWDAYSSLSYSIWWYSGWYRLSLYPIWEVYIDRIDRSILSFVYISNSILLILLMWKYTWATTKTQIYICIIYCNIHSAETIWRQYQSVVWYSCAVDQPITDAHLMNI